MMRYDERSNSWMYASSKHEEKGHVYESLAFDRQTAEIYTGYYPAAPLAASGALKKLAPDASLVDWQSPATAGFGVMINNVNQPALCWHPNLFGSADGGVLALHKPNGPAVVIAWRKRTNTWHSLDETSTTMTRADGQTYTGNGAIEYVRGGDYCIASFNPTQGGKSWRINAGSGGALSKAVQIEDVPVRCGYLSGDPPAGVLIDDPTGAPTPYILEKGGSSRVWKYEAGNWTQKGYKHLLPMGTVGNGVGGWAVASCYPLGVFWSRGGRSGTPSLLWRPND